MKEVTFPLRLVTFPGLSGFCLVNWYSSGCNPWMKSILDKYTAYKLRNFSPRTTSNLSYTDVVMGERRNLYIMLYVLVIGRHDIYSYVC